MKQTNELVLLKIFELNLQQRLMQTAKEVYFRQMSSNMKYRLNAISFILETIKPSRRICYQARYPGADPERFGGGGM